MRVSLQDLSRHIREFDFSEIMVECLGWNHYRAEPLLVRVDNHEYALRPVAEKSDFVVLQCAPSPDGSIPPRPIRTKIEIRAAKRHYEHILIFVDEQESEQVWQWADRKPGTSSAVRREESFQRGQSGLRIAQILQAIYFSLEEEASLTISHVVHRTRQAFDAAKLTKGFYKAFKDELSAFTELISGITEQGGRDWYASLMLNRMMFIYFIQKQRFLDDDSDYLRNRLSMIRDRGTKDRFQDFYRIFLLRLFRDGLGQPENLRTPELLDLLGEVPFLNGGLFDVHELEEDNPDISIPDEAFERLFDFFDRYRWHLDERPNRQDNEINPDVLGYIFEKYINQKQMGAYYTREDVTGYITSNTVLPVLIDDIGRAAPAAFGAGGAAWSRIQAEPDHYMYPDLRHGLTWNAHDARSLSTPLPLPEPIASGSDDVTGRKQWNETAPPEYALPGETWRDVVDRRQRYEELRSRIVQGEVREASDLISLNLDITRFTSEAISGSEDPETLRAFWRLLSEVSILDPACGSGAFLFAALNVLEPLYTACLQGMQGFLDDVRRNGQVATDSTRYFEKVLRYIKEHPSERYFILKSIVLNNLYGVDIMEEAVEICKLRLFLKLVAQLESRDQIEPLPDIDFNIRAGNSLIGFADLDAVHDSITVSPDGQQRTPFDEDRRVLDRINRGAAVAGGAFDQFRRKQTSTSGVATAQDKASLRRHLRAQSDELDRFLATEYSVGNEHPAAFRSWRRSHKPFHWFLEFYGVMAHGGFDAVIGNPPYVQYTRDSLGYRFLGSQYRTLACGDLYSLFTERSIKLLRSGGRVGLILPISIFSAGKFTSLQDFVRDSADPLWISCFANRPSQLFQGAQNRLTILLARSSFGTEASGRHVSTSQYFRWRPDERSTLFTTRIAYATLESHHTVLPNALEKLGSPLEIHAFRRLVRPPGERLAAALVSNSRFKVVYTRAFSYFLAFLESPPEVLHLPTGTVREPSELKSLYLASRASAMATIAALSSSTFFWYYCVVSDGRHLNKREITAFSFNPEKIEPSLRQDLAELGETYLRRLRRTSGTMLKSNLRIETFDHGSCKDVLDEIDEVLAGHYGLNAEELDFIKNYDLKYRIAE